MEANFVNNADMRWVALDDRPDVILLPGTATDAQCQGRNLTPFGNQGIGGFKTSKDTSVLRRSTPILGSGAWRSFYTRSGLKTSPTQFF